MRLNQTDTPDDGGGRRRHIVQVGTPTATRQVRNLGPGNGYFAAESEGRFMASPKSLEALTLTHQSEIKTAWKRRCKGNLCSRGRGGLTGQEGDPKVSRIA